MEARGWLEQLEERLSDGDDQDAFSLLALLAGAGVELDEDELRGALRRGVLLLATGGDPRRGPELDGRAVREVANDLASNEAKAGLQAGLARVLDDARGLVRTERALRTLVGDPDLAWRSFACALLAEELGDER